MPDAPPVTATTRPLKSPAIGVSPGVSMSLSLTRSDDRLPLLAEPIDSELHDVAGLEPDGWVESHADSWRRTGVDQVAGLEDEELADVVHDDVRVEDHRRGGALLAPDTVDVQPHREVADVAQLVRGDEPRPCRVERLGRLALDPLAASLELERALGDVIDDDEPGDGIVCIVDAREIAGTAADHDPELDLPVRLGRSAGDAYVVIRSDQSVGRLGEQDRLQRNFLTGLSR